jgi:hypothetical protein
VNLPGESIDKMTDYYVLSFGNTPGVVIEFDSESDDPLSEYTDGYPGSYRFEMTDGLYDMLLDGHVEGDTRNPQVKLRINDSGKLKLVSDRPEIRLEELIDQDEADRRQKERRDSKDWT